jgi:hypothetical protein
MKEALLKRTPDFEKRVQRWINWIMTTASFNSLYFKQANNKEIKTFQQKRIGRIG